MEFTFLGTAAAEGVPAVFCNCKYCLKARKTGGKNIRTRSQALVNDDFLIDLPADTYSHFLNNAIIGDRIKYIFITHSHSDHFYPEELKMRHGGFAHDMQVPQLQVYCNKGAYEKIGEYENVKVNLVTPYERIFAGEYEVIPLPAKHYDGDGAVFYIIKYKGKTLLYAHDTGIPFEEIFEYIENEKFKFDFITFDCTYGELIYDDNGNHMGFNHLERVVKRMKDFGAIDNKTQIYVNHFSHNGNPLQENLERLSKPLGFKVAYDGCKVEI